MPRDPAVGTIEPGKKGSAPDGGGGGGGVAGGWGRGFGWGGGVGWGLAAVVGFFVIGYGREGVPLLALSSPLLAAASEEKG